MGINFLPQTYTIDSDLVKGSGGRVRELLDLYSDSVCETNRGIESAAIM